MYSRSCGRMFEAAGAETRNMVSEHNWRICELLLFRAAFSFPCLLLSMTAKLLNNAGLVARAYPTLCGTLGAVVNITGIGRKGADTGS